MNSDFELDFIDTPPSLFDICLLSDFEKSLKKESQSLNSKVSQNIESFSKCSLQKLNTLRPADYDVTYTQSKQK